MFNSPVCPSSAMCYGELPGIWQRSGQRFAFLVVAAIVLLPLIQLIPLPPFLWTALAGRASFASAYQEAALGVPWLGISLDPAATWRSALALIPPVAVFLSTVLLGRAARRVLAAGIVAFAFVSVLLGLAQLTQGSGSPLRLFAVTNSTEAVGFFANRNHFAALLYSALPLTAAFAVGFANGPPARNLGRGGALPAGLCVTPSWPWNVTLAGPASALRCSLGSEVLRSP